MNLEKLNRQQCTKLTDISLGFVEAGRQKCAVYWPELYHKEEFGDFEVELQEEVCVSSPAITIRIMTLRCDQKFVIGILGSAGWS